MWIDVLANRQLATKDDAFGLVANFQKHFFTGDAHHGARDEFALFDFNERAVEFVGERCVSFGDLARNVVATLVKGAH